MFKLSKEANKYYSNLAIGEICNLNEFEGLAFECNDGAVEIVYLDEKKRSSKYSK